MAVGPVSLSGTLEKTVKEAMFPEQGPQGTWNGTRQPPRWPPHPNQGQCLALPGSGGSAMLWVDGGHQQLSVKLHSAERILAHCCQECHRQERKCESQEGKKCLVQLCHCQKPSRLGG